MAYNKALDRILNELSDVKIRHIRQGFMVVVTLTRRTLLSLLFLGGTSFAVDFREVEATGWLAW